MSEENTTPVVAPKLSRAQKLTARATLLAERISKDTAEYNEVVNEINSAEALKTVAEGSVVQVKLGRRFSAEKDTTRIVDAVVVGVRTDEEGTTQFKVQYGSGFDAEQAVVNAGQIVGVAAPAAE
jgi:hypothetical protein